MLVLSRKLNEEIVIGENIVIRLVEIQNRKKVRLGITAPKDIPVNRRELLDENLKLPPEPEA